MRKQVYSDEELLNIIKEKEKELGRTPKKREVVQYGIIASRFGSWNNALEKANLKVRKRIGYKQEQLLDQIRLRAKEVNRQLKKEDIKNPDTMRKYFGTVSNAIRLAGEKTFYKTDKELIEQLKELANKLHRTPNKQDMLDNNLETVGTYINRFGSWNKALKLAYIKINMEKSEVIETDEELKEQYINLCNKLDRFATTKEIDLDENMYSNNVYVDRFKSISNLREIIFNDSRLTISDKKYIHRNNVYTDSELKEMLKEVINVLDKVTKENVIKKLKELKYPSINTFFRRFQIKGFKDLLGFIEK